MAKGLEEVIETIIEEICYRGTAGLSVNEFVDLAVSCSRGEAPKPPPEPQDGEDGSSARPDVPTIHPESRLSVARKVWGWLVSRHDFIVGGDRHWNKLSLDEVLALPVELDADKDTSAAQSAGNSKDDASQHRATPRKSSLKKLEPLTTRPSLFVANDTLWKTLTRHGVDYKRIPPMEWSLLLGIATSKEKGIFQGELCRLVGQDKRSVPRRTDFLAQKGYIAKRPIMIRGSKTSKLWLASMAPPLLNIGLSGLVGSDLSRESLTKNTSPVHWHGRWTGDAIDFEAFGRTLISITKAWSVIRYGDLKSKLGVEGRKWQMRVLARECRLLTDMGIIRYADARLDHSRQIYKNCIKFLRDLTSDEWEKFIATGKKSSLYSDRTRDRQPKPNALTIRGKALRPPKQPADDQEIEDEDEDEEGTQQTPFAWVPEKPLISTMIEAIQESGPEGASTPQVSTATVGYNLRRFVGSTLLSLVQTTQPPHLAKFQLSSEHVRTGKTAAYMYRLPLLASTEDMREAGETADAARVAAHPVNGSAFATVKPGMLSAKSGMSLSALVRAGCRPGGRRAGRQPGPTVHSGKEVGLQPLGKDPADESIAGKEDDAVDNPDPPTKKRRGRPPKARKEETPSPGEQDVDAVKRASASAGPPPEESTPILPRKPGVYYGVPGSLTPQKDTPSRGRPRRSLVLAIVTSEKLPDMGVAAPSKPTHEGSTTINDSSNSVAAVTDDDVSPRLRSSVRRKGAQLNLSGDSQDKSSSQSPSRSRKSIQVANLPTNHDVHAEDEDLSPQPIGSDASMDVRYDGRSGKLKLSESQHMVVFVPEDDELEPGLLTISARDLAKEPSIRKVPRGRNNALVFDTKDGGQHAPAWTYIFSFDNTSANSRAAATIVEVLDRLMKRVAQDAAAIDLTVDPASPLATSRSKKVVARGGARPWKCENCGKSWKNEGGLKYHVTKSQTNCNPEFSQVQPLGLLDLPRKRRRLTDAANGPKSDGDSEGEEENSASDREDDEHRQSVDHRDTPRKPGYRHYRKRFSIHDFGPRQALRSEHAQQFRGFASSGRGRAEHDEPRSQENTSDTTPQSAHETAGDHADEELQQPGVSLGVESQIEWPKKGERITDESTNGAVSTKPILRKKQDPEVSEKGAAAQAPAAHVSSALPLEKPGPDGPNDHPASTYSSATLVPALEAETLPADRPPSVEPEAPRLTNQPNDSDVEDTQQDDDAQQSAAEAESGDDDEGSASEDEFFAPFAAQKHSRTMTATVQDIIRHLVATNEGGFPSGDALEYVIGKVYKVSFNKEDPPGRRVCTAALNALSYEIVEHLHRFRNTSGELVDLKLLLRRGIDPHGPLASDIYSKMREALPGTYIPPPFTLSDEELRSLQEERQKKATKAKARVAGTRAEKFRHRRTHEGLVEVLDAPYYQEAIGANFIESEDEAETPVSEAAGHQVHTPRKRAARGSPAEPPQKRRRTIKDSPTAEQNSSRQEHRTVVSDIFAAEVVSKGEAPMAEMEPEEMDEGLSPSISKTTSQEPLSSVRTRASSRLRARRKDSRNVTFAPVTDIEAVASEQGYWPGVVTETFNHETSFTLSGPLQISHREDELPKSAMELASRNPGRRLSTALWKSPHRGEFESLVERCARYETDLGNKLMSSAVVLPGSVFYHFSSPVSESSMKPIAPKWATAEQYSLKSFPWHRFDAQEEEANFILDTPVDTSPVTAKRSSEHAHGPASTPTRGVAMMRRIERPAKRHHSAAVRRKYVRQADKFPQLPAYKPSRPMTSIMQEVDTTLRSVGDSQYDLDWAADETRIAAFVCIRTLLGGVGKTNDWGLYQRLMPEVQTLSSLKKWWIGIQKSRKNFITELEIKFQREFLKAYENNQIPLLDYDDILSYDWKWLTAWTLGLADRNDRPNSLPGTRKALGKHYDLLELDYAAPDWREKFYHVQTSVVDRYHVATADAAALPVAAPPTDLHDNMTVAKSVLRALCVTETRSYPPQQVKRKLKGTLLELSEAEANALYKRASDELNQAKIITLSTYKLTNGRVWRMNGVYLKMLDRLTHWDDFIKAFDYKKQLDDAFGRVDKTTKRVTYITTGGMTLALQNLQAADRVRVEPINAKHAAFGHNPGDYETRKWDKKIYHFRMEATPTDSYIFNDGAELAAILRRARETPVPGVGPRGVTPIWCDLSGEIDQKRWAQYVAVVLFNAGTRGTVDVHQLHMSMKTVLMGFEAQMLLDWGEEVGILRRLLPGDYGLSVTEWWWLVVGALVTEAEEKSTKLRRLRKANERYGDGTPVLEGSVGEEEDQEAARDSEQERGDDEPEIDAMEIDED